MHNITLITAVSMILVGGFLASGQFITFSVFCDSSTGECFNVPDPLVNQTVSVKLADTCSPYYGQNCSLPSSNPATFQGVTDANGQVTFVVNQLIYGNAEIYYSCTGGSASLTPANVPPRYLVTVAGQTEATPYVLGKQTIYCPGGTVTASDKGTASAVKMAFPSLNGFVVVQFCLNSCSGVQIVSQTLTTTLTTTAATTLTSTSTATLTTTVVSGTTYYVTSTTTLGNFVYNVNVQNCYTLPCKNGAYLPVSATSTSASGIVTTSAYTTDANGNAQVIVSNGSTNKITASCPNNLGIPVSTPNLGTLSYVSPYPVQIFVNCGSTQSSTTTSSSTLLGTSTTLTVTVTATNTTFRTSTTTVTKISYSTITQSGLTSLSSTTITSTTIKCYNALNKEVTCPSPSGLRDSQLLGLGMIGLGTILGIMKRVEEEG